MRVFAERGRRSNSDRRFDRERLRRLLLVLLLRHPCALGRSVSRCVGRIVPPQVLGSHDSFAVPFGGALANYGWRAVKVHTPNEHPAFQVTAMCDKGVWTFTAEGRVERSARDLRLRGGRDVQLN